MFLILHGAAAPTDAEWSLYINDLRAALRRRGNDMSNLPTLVFSDGGAPNVIQRTAINEAQEQTGTTGPVAFISESPLVRGVTQSLAWFNPKFKVYGPRNFLDALAYLSVPGGQVTLVKSRILALEHDLGQKVRAVRSLFTRSFQV
jgi:hypothetical protein